MTQKCILENTSYYWIFVTLQNKLISSPTLLLLTVQGNTRLKNLISWTISTCLTLQQTSSALVL